MNVIKLKQKWFNIPDDGIGYSDEKLIITVVMGDSSVTEVEELLNPVPEQLDIYYEDKETKSGGFYGYTEIESITKEFNRRIDREISADAITFVLKTPGIEKTIERNEAQTFYTAMMTDTLLEEE